MKQQNALLKYTLPFLLFVVIIAGLINTSWFYGSTYSAYYFFAISALIFTLTTTLSSLFLNTHIAKNKPLSIFFPVIFLGIWFLYVLVHYINHTASTLFTIYIVLHFLFLQSTIKLFSSSHFNFRRLCYGIALITAVESLYCLGQYFSVFKSQNEFFAVTGSCINPNVIAQFLAITIPVFLYLLQFKYKKIILSSLGIVLIALLLLKCRSAYIATIVAVLIYYCLEYDFIKWIRNPKNRSSAKSLFIVFLLIVIPTVTHLYNSKKASADGRQFIWKLSAMMSTQKPLTGYGYGSFDKEYNLFQADYIAKGKATLEEQTIAGPTLMAYNEAFQNIVEGGTIGLLLILLLFGSLLFSIRQKRKVNLNCTINPHQDDLPAKNSVFHLAYAGVVGFITMSMFNFSIQAVPVMTLFIIYAAMICSQLDPISISSTFSFLNTKWVRLVTKITICISCLYLFFVLLHIAHADMLNKKASILKKEGHLKEALQLMPKLEYWLKEESNYWKNYGNILFLNKEYGAALNCLSKAKITSSSPDLYLGSGRCHEKLYQYPAAIIQYQQLVLLHPSKFNYRFRLMAAYLQNKDTLNTLLAAQGIINMKPKIPSEEVVQYKKNAQKIIFALDKNAKNKLPITKNFGLTPQKTLNFK